MRAKEALELFAGESVSAALRLLELFLEEEWRLAPEIFTGAAKEERALPRYDAVGAAEIPAPAAWEKDEAQAAAAERYAPAEKGEDPFYLTVYERAGDELYFSETAVTEEYTVFGTDAPSPRIIFEGSRAEHPTETGYSTSSPVETGTTARQFPQTVTLVEKTSPQVIERAERPAEISIPTMDEILDELERRLIRELQTETEGIY